MGTVSLDSAISFIFDLIDRLVSLLSSVYFTISGYRVSYFWLVIAFILISILVSVFWRGAKG